MVVPAHVDERWLPGLLERPAQSGEQFLVGRGVEVLDQCPRLSEEIGDPQRVITGYDRAVRAGRFIGMVCNQDHLPVPRALQGLGEPVEKLGPLLPGSRLEEPVGVEEGDPDVPPKVADRGTGVTGCGEERDEAARRTRFANLLAQIEDPVEAGIAAVVSPVVIAGDKETHRGMLRRFDPADQIDLLPEPRRVLRKPGVIAVANSLRIDHIAHVDDRHGRVSLECGRPLLDVGGQGLRQRRPIGHLAAVAQEKQDRVDLRRVGNRYLGRLRKFERIDVEKVGHAE